MSTMECDVLVISSDSDMDFEAGRPASTTEESTQNTENTLPVKSTPSPQAKKAANNVHTISSSDSESDTESNKLPVRNLQWDNPDTFHRSSETSELTDKSKDNDFWNLLMAPTTTGNLSQESESSLGDCSSSQRDAIIQFSSTNSQLVHTNKDVVKVRKRGEGPNAKELKAQEVARRKEERARKKAEAEAEKNKQRAIKAVQSESRKIMQPGECIKYMTAIVDPHVLELSVGSQILTHLQTCGVTYTIQEQEVSCSISWKREKKTHSLNVLLELEKQSTFEEEKELIVVIDVNEFVKMAYEQMTPSGTEQTLCEHVTFLQSKAQDKRLTLIIEGLKNYFKKQKASSQRDFKARVAVSESQPAPSQPRRRKNRKEELPTISELEVQTVLVDLQFETECTCHFVDSSEELAELVARFTKAVAEAPFKRERNKEVFDWYSAAEFSGSGKVDKLGNGLLNIWKQQLQQFGVGAEVADAISAIYPSPDALLKSYDGCESKDAAKKLLQDIMVRRGTGILASTRRIGPLLSQKIYLFFTCHEPTKNLQD